MILEVRDLSLGFPQKPLLSNLSFQIKDPCFIAVIGHNGSGKSTFLKALVAQQSSSGDIFIKGKSLNSLSRSELAAYVSFLEQKNNLSFDIKVIDLVEMGRFRFKKFFSNYDNADYQLAREALNNLEVLHLEKENFLSLSGGEQQLVWFAQLTLQNSDIILLDEPTQQLDLYNKKRIFDQMEKWSIHQGKVVVCVTHDIINLYDMEGYFINFSETKPQLRKIDKENLDHHLNLLQAKREKTC